MSYWKHQYLNNFTLLKIDNEMIRAKLLLLQFDTLNKEPKNEKKLNTILDLKKLLKQIDFNVEVVPMEDEVRLLNFFSSLKNKPLSIEEKGLIHELVNYKIL